jgi:hypothetical protein
MCVKLTYHLKLFITYLELLLQDLCTFDVCTYIPYFFTESESKVNLFTASESAVMIVNRLKIK